MKHFIAAATLITLTSTPALAQTYQQGLEEGPYLGAGLGQAKLDNETLDWLDDAGFNTDDSDTGYKLFAGYQFNPNFAVEASYLDFGNFSANESYGDAYGYKYTANSQLSVEGFGVALVGKLPIQNGFSVHGKLGMIAWDVDWNGVEKDNYQTESWDYNEDGTDPFYGLGAEYVINQFMLRGEYERYAISDSSEDLDIDMVSASIGYRF